MNVPATVAGRGEHERIEFSARRSENASVCTEAASVADVHNDVAERLKVALCVELFQQSHSVAPEQRRVLCAETAPLRLILTVTANNRFINY